PGRPQKNEMRFVGAEGTARVFYSRAIPVLNQAGTVHKIRGISRDVTNHRAGESRLRKSGALPAQAEQIANLASWEIDTQSNAVHWSDNMSRMLGIDAPPQPIPINQLGKWGHSEDAERVQNDLRLAMSEGIAFDHESRFVLPNGQIRSLFVRGMPIRDAGGTVTRVVGVTQDITEQKESQRARRES